WRGRAVRGHGAGVSGEAGALRPPHGAPAEAGAERVAVEIEQLFERPRGARRRERRLARPRGLPVPGAHVLAHVAPEHPLPDRFPELLGNIAAVLDREVRDAPSRVEGVWPDERLGRAGVEARRARAASVGQTLIPLELAGRAHAAAE